MKDLSAGFSPNRAEEFGLDVWNEFVVPLFFDQIKIRDQTKSLVVIGGRGCGKTTLLHYFSHYTRFSIRRQIADFSDDLRYIGLYHRADTNFLSALDGDAIPERTRHAAFRHYLSCNLGLELLDSLHSINQTEHRKAQYGKLDHLDFSELAGLYPESDFGSNFARLYQSLNSSRVRLSVWLNNLETIPPPAFLPVESFLPELIRIIKKQLPYLTTSTFAVFIDEYENLLSYQKKMINGLLKHCKSPLIYNVAMKRNGFTTRETMGPESLQHIHDYNILDLENELEPNFDLFSAEILCFKLLELGAVVQESSPIDPAALRDPEKVQWRRDDHAYREAVLGAARRILPKSTEREVAAEILRDSQLRKRLQQNIQKSLEQHGSKLNVELFLSEAAPEASVVCSALLSRKKEKPETVLAELQSYREEKSNRFSDGGWLHNNLFGTILQIYTSIQAPCPLYAGFDSFIIISHGNLRHFLALLHYAFLESDRSQGTADVPVIPQTRQALVVRSVSHDFLSEVRGAGSYGNQLHAMALTLGALFRQKQRLLSQSEPEINHFHLTKGEVPDTLATLLNESVKWSVLFEEKETKKKNSGIVEHDYVLNPIFCGYFQISFRKKRSIGLSELELMTMFNGKLEDRDRLVRNRGGDDNEGVSTLALDFEGRK